MRLLFLLVSVLALFSSVPAQDSTRVKTDKIDGVICTNVADWKFRFKRNEFWNPTKDDVLKAEEQIETYLKTDAKLYPNIWRKLPNYKRQYLGIIVNGHKRIFCNFFCFNDEPLTDKPVFWKDGGDCYFQIEYDLNDAKCYNLRVNGEA
jgi:hypothetical protein